MNVRKNLVCLNMIVKNEADVILRCLMSVRPFIDYWVIIDTGSTDGTQTIIREYLHDLPGELHERPWQDFASNRSEALALAREKREYTLIIDADDTLAIAQDGVPAELTADAYMLTIRDGSTVYRRTQLVRSAMPWRYEGVLHEYITCDGAAPAEHLPGVEMRRNHDGARRKDPETYRRDAAILERALQSETKPFLVARYTFYLAQSYRDCRDWEKALIHYLARAALGYWQEEVFISLYYAAQMKEQLGYPDQDIIDSYLHAATALPTRVEALYRASRFCRLKERYEEGYHIAKRGLAILMPSDALFVEPRAYEFGLQDEFSLNAYWSGRYRECLDTSLRILAGAELSVPDRRRIVENARFASEKLPLEPALGSYGAEGFGAQHVLKPARALYPVPSKTPRVMIAIIANQKERLLPLYLKCIESLDYPKSSITLYVSACGSTDGTRHLLREWIDRIGQHYAEVVFDNENLQPKRVAPGSDTIGHDTHRQIRSMSLRHPVNCRCDFYFVADPNNMIRTGTLRELVALDLPIVAPFLRSIGPSGRYSNYHAEVDANGYYVECDQYDWILNRLVRGLLELPVVNCTYLVRTDVLDKLTYEDGTSRHDYVIFSESARKAEIPQYLDNRQVYGYVVFGEGNDPHLAGDIERAESLLDHVTPLRQA